MSDIDSFGLVFVFTMLFCFVLFIIFYIFDSLAKQKMLKNLGYGNPWMAWIPFAREYALADVTRVDPARILGIDIPMSVFRFYFLIEMGASFLTVIPIIGFLISIVMTVFLYAVRYYIFSMTFSMLHNTNRQDETGLSIACMFIPIIADFIWISSQPNEYFIANGMVRNNNNNNGFYYDNTSNSYYSNQQNPYQNYPQQGPSNMTFGKSGDFNGGQQQENPYVQQNITFGTNQSQEQNSTGNKINLEK